MFAKIPFGKESHSSYFDTTYRAFNYVIHPAVATCLPNSVRIADLGTGTGAWAIDVAQTLPGDVLVTAVDNSSAQYPKDVPGKTTFFVADITDRSFAEEYCEIFDLVHLRHMMTALHSSDLESTFANVCRLLKPGGCIQWTEARYGTMSCLRASSDPEVYSALSGVLAKFWQGIGSRLAEQAPKLCKLLHQSDLINVQIDAVSTDYDPLTRSHWAQMLAPAYINWTVENFGLSAEEGIALKAGIDNEIEHGAFPLHSELNVERMRD